MIQCELHSLPTDVMPTCPILTGKTGPTRRSTQEEAVVQSRMHRPPRKSAGTQPAQEGCNNNPEYTNTQQDLPNYGIYLADS